MMIRNARPFKGLKTRLKRIKVLGDGIDMGTVAEGYYVGDGTLTSVRKFSAYNYDAKLDKIEWIEYFNTIKYGIALTANGDIYKWSETANGAAFGIVTNGVAAPHTAFACRFEGSPAVCVLGGTKLVFVYETGFASLSLTFELNGGCLHMGRIFAADTQKKYTIRWSGTDLSDWNQSALGGGYIDLDPVRGRIFRLVSMGNKIFVYREFGVDVIKVYGDPYHLSIVHKGSGDVTEKLTESACAVCGDKMYFCSKTNVYTFDGEKIERVKYPECLAGQNFRTGTCIDGRYVTFYCEDITGTSSYQFEIDTLNGVFAHYAEGMPFVWKSPNAFYGWFNNTVYREDAKSERMISRWFTGTLTLGISSTKLIKSIYTECSGKIVIHVITNSAMVGFTAENGKKIKVGLWDDSFSFRVTGNGKLKLLECECEVRE